MTFLQSLIRYLSQASRIRCFICHDHCTDAYPICLECKQNLPFLLKSCEQCAAPLESKVDNRCGHCLTHVKSYERTIALFDYQPPINSFIIQLKFAQRLALGSFLGELLATKLIESYQQQALPTCILPVPLHASRLKERGFNQAVVIAKPIAKQLNIPIAHHIIHRIKATAPQSQLPKNKRRRNIKDAFRVQLTSDLEHIAVLDDVITTGVTVHELCSQLKINGIQRIDVWAVAKRTLASHG